MNYFRSRKAKKANAPRSVLLELEKPALPSVVVVIVEAAVDSAAAAEIVAMVAEGTEGPGRVVADEALAVEAKTSTGLAAGFPGT